jgi:hypothetical protein
VHSGTFLIHEHILAVSAKHGLHTMLDNDGYIKWYCKEFMPQQDVITMLSSGSATSHVTTVRQAEIFMFMVPLQLRSQICNANY